MDKVITQLELLTKHIMGDPLKVVNIIASISVKSYDIEETNSLDKEIHFV